MLADLIYDTVSDLTWKLGSNYPINAEIRDARRKLVGMGQLEYDHDSASFEAADLWEFPVTVTVSDAGGTLKRKVFKMRQLTFDELFESTEPAPKQFPLARPVIRSLARKRFPKR